MDTIINERKQNLGEKLYIIAIILGISGALLLDTMFPWGSKAMYLVRMGLVLCFFKSIFIDRYTPMQFWAYVISFGAAILSYDPARHNMLIIIPFIFAAKDVDFKKIMKAYLITVLILVLTINLLSIVGKVPNLVFWRDGKSRISYGFSYPTIEAGHIFYFLLIYTVFKKFKLNWLEDIIIAFAGWFIISKGDARLDGYLTFALLFIVIFRKLIFKLLSKLNNFIPAILVIFLVIGYLLLAKNFDSMNPKEFALNQVLSNRLYLTQQGLARYPLNLFGHHVEMHGFGGYSGLAIVQTGWMARNYFFIDSGFVQVLLINGIVLFTIMMITIVYLSWKNMKIKNYSIVIAIVFLTISGLIEGFALDLPYDILIVIVLANTSNWVKGENNSKREIKTN